MTLPVEKIHTNSDFALPFFASPPCTHTSTPSPCLHPLPLVPWQQGLLQHPGAAPRSKQHCRLLHQRSCSADLRTVSRMVCADSRAQGLVSPFSPGSLASLASPASVRLLAGKLSFSLFLLRRQSHWQWVPCFWLRIVLYLFQK